METLPRGEYESVERSKGIDALKSGEPQVGDVLAGKYELRGIIGRGGFGVVYEALHLGIQRKIALKVLPPEFSNKDPDLAIRFRREGLLASELRHPNTITIYDYGHGDGGLLYMAMEYVSGRTLAMMLRDEAPVEGLRVVHIVRQILGSLSEAHQRGIVHRDLKPGNIMLTRLRGDPDFVKVLDFGIAKAVSSDLLAVPDVGQALTQEGRFCGTPRYMAPEQFRNAPISQAVDIYSLGLIAYELLTGLPAVQGETMVDLIVAQVTGTDLAIPPEIELDPIARAAINKALRKAPAERFKSAQEFIAALQPERDEDANEEELGEGDFTVELPKGVNPFQALRRTTEQTPLLRSSLAPQHEHKHTLQDMPALGHSSSPSIPAVKAAGRATPPVELGTVPALNPEPGPPLQVVRSVGVPALPSREAPQEEATYPRAQKERAGGRRALQAVPEAPPPGAGEGDVLESTVELRAERVLPLVRPALPEFEPDEATIDIAASDMLAQQLQVDYYKHIEQAQSAELPALERPARRRGPSANPSSFGFDDDGPTQQVNPALAQKAMYQARLTEQARRNAEVSAGVPGSSQSLTVPLQPVSAAPAGSRKLLYVGAGVAALLLSLGCFWAALTFLGPQPPTSTPTPPAEEKSAGELIKIDIKTDPPNATLIMDSEPVGLTPRTITRPRGTRVTLIVQKDGYFGSTETLRFDKDRARLIKLQPQR